jgi:hypothetical protein
MQRRRFKQFVSLKDRLVSFSNEVRKRASLMPPCEERDALLTKARQADAASHLSDWAILGNYSHRNEAKLSVRLLSDPLAT